MRGWVDMVEKVEWKAQDLVKNENIVGSADGVFYMTIVTVRCTCSNINM
jgi:hypothetical protein